MRKTIFFAAVAAIFAITSCQKEAPVKGQSDDPVFTAEIVASKTTVDAELGKVSWEMNDVITVTDAAQTSVKYEATEILESGAAIFTKLDEETNTGTLGDGSYTATYGIDPEQKQAYTGEVPELPMEASSQTTHFQFEVTCGLLELKLKAYEKVDSIKVGGRPATKATALTDYTLTCKEAVNISDTTKFYIALPAGDYYRILIYGQNGAVCKKQNMNAGIAITANHITPVSFSKALHFAVQLWKDGPYWATTNIGAATPEEFGRYFYWGDVEGQTWTGTAWSEGGFYTNPSYLPSSGQNMAQEYDAAHVLLGGNWRMPTKGDFEALISNCTTTPETDYNHTGIGGMIFTGKNSGYTDKSIFLPNAGYGLENSIVLNSLGYYWSSTFSIGSAAWELAINTSCYVDEENVRFALPIRPVYVEQL